MPSIVDFMYRCFLYRPGHVSEDLDGYESKRVAQFPTPSRRVQGTALRAPLQVSSTEINFHLPSGYLEMGIETSAGRAAVCFAFNPG